MKPFEREEQPNESLFMRAQRLNPPVRSAHQALYEAVMAGPSPLSPAERRSIAVVVSAANRSGY